MFLENKEWGRQNIEKNPPKYVQTLFHIYMYIDYTFVTHKHTQWWGIGFCLQRAKRSIKYFIIIWILYRVFSISCMKIHILSLCICLGFSVFFQCMNSCCWRFCAFARLIFTSLFQPECFLRWVLITSVHTCFCSPFIFIR